MFGFDPRLGLASKSIARRTFKESTFVSIESLFIEITRIAPTLRAAAENVFHLYRVRVVLCVG